MLSVVIPAHNAADTLADTIDSVLAPARHADVIVVDGGSYDATRTIAETRGARVIETRPGRGRQLATGTTHAQNDWLLFLHGDTRLSTGWIGDVDHFIADDKNLACAGYFRLTFDEQSRESARVARLANWRARALGLPYGDQGLLIHRAFLSSIGGYREDLDVMEDVDLVRRIGKKRLRCLSTSCITSARRYRAQGWWRRPARNLLCLTLYFLGAPSPWIKRLYA